VAAAHDSWCVTCNAARRPVASKDATYHYQIVVYKCASCRSTLQLVERKQPPLRRSVERRRVKLQSDRG
jgi:hypothetical protein